MSFPLNPSPRSILGLGTVARLDKAGFTVTDRTIVGGDDGLLAKLLTGGKHRVTRLRQLGIRLDEEEAE